MSKRTNPASSSTTPAKRAFTATSMPLVDTTADAASSLDSCVLLAQQGDGARVRMPWVGFGTYKLPKAKQAVTSALQTAGYRLVDTAFIYGGEKTEPEVGAALEAALATRPRDSVFVTTKHWRKFHGYEESLKCLRTSLRRLRLEHVDLWLMHWPGPAWTTMNRRNDMIEQHGAWHYAAAGHEEANIAALRAETWRGMEEALARGWCRAIGVSNFTVEHLRTLKATARVWPPAVNQVELHPYHQQRELQEYCAQEGIVLQAYASLGGQDASRAKLEALGGSLLTSPAVLGAAEAHGVTAAQVLLRWALQKKLATVPKSSSEARMLENSAVFGFALSAGEVASFDILEQGDAGRLCWKNDPLRLLAFS